LCFKQTFDNNNKNMYPGVESLGLHGNWVTLFGFINAHDLHYYDGIVSHLCGAAGWWWLIVRKEFYENIIATAVNNRSNILLYFTCRSHDDDGTAIRFLAIVDGGYLCPSRFDRVEESCTCLFALTPHTCARE